MSALHPFINRLDAAGGRAIAFGSDDDLAEGMRTDASGMRIVGFQHLKAEIGRNAKAALDRLIPVLRRQWPDAPLEKVQDAAKAIIKRHIAPLVDPRFDGVTDFTSSSLELVGGAGENIVRPTPPTLFVPGPGRTVALQSRNVLKPGYRTNSFKIREHVGQAVWGEPNAMREVPNVDYQDEKEVRGAAYYMSKYSWSIPDTWEAAIVGDDMPGERQFAAVEALDRFREAASWWGSTDKNIEGMATISGAMLLLGGQQFSAMALTAVQMLQRIAAMEARYMLGNQGRRPSHSIIPHADRLAMQNTWFGSDSNGDSAWDKAIKQFPWIANAMFSDNLMEANHAGTATRWIIYTADPKNLYVEHMDTMVFGPFDDYTNQTYVLLRRHGGVVAKLPETVLYADFTA